jgi:LPS-assembly lipoprotein
MGLALLAGLAGCGFQLRGQSQLPFPAAYVEARESSVLAEPLRQALSAQSKLASRAEGAPVRIVLTDEARTKTILALSGGGKVREYRLAYRLRLIVSDAAGNELIAPSDIQLNRDFSYSDAEILAKEAEEASLNRAMEQDALRQVLRRLSYVKR